MDQYQQETPDLPRPVPDNSQILLRELQQRLVYLEQRLQSQQNEIDRLRRQLHQLDTNHRITQHRVFRNE